MRKIFFAAIAFVFIGSVQSNAQFWGGPPMEFGNVGKEDAAAVKPETPAEIASHITDTLNVLLQLNEKQYKKVYKLALKEQRKVYNDSVNDLMPDFGAFRGGPDFDGMGGGGFTQTPEEAVAAKIKKQEKTAARRGKEMKKILTPEQWSIYQKCDVKAVFRVKEATLNN